MIIESPSEIAFFIFGLPVYWYGVILACAVLVGVIVAEKLSKNVPSGFFIDSSPVFILTGIFGARLYYCFLNFPYYLKNPLQIFDIRQGGLSIHGMILAGILAVFWIAKKNNMKFLEIADILACACAVAQSIGRWGNFFNSEAFGIPTYSNWGVFIPQSNRPISYLSEELFHPTFLYESVLDLIIFFVLIFILRKQSVNGVVFFAYLILYSFARIFVEQIRLDSALNIMGFPVAQIVSVVLMFCGIIGIFYVNKKTI